MMGHEGIDTWWDALSVAEREKILKKDAPNFSLEGCTKDWWNLPDKARKLIEAGVRSSGRDPWSEDFSALPIRPAPKVNCSAEDDAWGNVYVSWENAQGAQCWSGPFSGDTAWAKARTLERRGVRNVGTSPIQPDGKKIGS